MIAGKTFMKTSFGEIKDSDDFLEIDIDMEVAYNALLRCPWMHKYNNPF